jgi:hypothetical protein
MFLHPLIEIQPIPVAASSKAWVCGRSLAGIAGSNPAGAWIFVSCELFVVSYRSLRRADYSSRGVLPSVACLSVIVKFDNEVAVGQ